MGAHTEGAIELGGAAAEGDDASAIDFGEADEHEADGPLSDDDDTVAGADMGFLEALEDAGEGFDEGGVEIAEMGGDLVHVALYDAGGDADIFSVGAVIEEEVLAEVFEAAAAIEAVEAGGGVGGDDALADVEAFDVFADGDDVAGEFVAEEGRRDDHFGVITAAKDLDVGATGKGGADADKDIAFLDFGNGDLFHAHLFAPVEHSSLHLLVHLRQPLWLNYYFHRIAIRMQSQLDALADSGQRQAM